MFRRDFMPRANYATLEKRERAFYRIGVNVSMDIFFGVIDSLVFFFGELGQSPRIDRGFIGHNHFYVFANMIFDDFSNCGRSGLFDTNQAKISVALTNSNDSLLLRTRTPPPRLAANVSLVNLNRAIKRLGSYFHHSSADSVTKIPRSFIGGLEHSTNLVRRHALLGLTKQVGSKKPLPQGQMGIVEDCSRRSRELVAAGVTVILVASRYARNLIRAARRALDTLRPAKFFEIGAALFFATKVLNQGTQV